MRMASQSAFILCLIAGTLQASAQEHDSPAQTNHNITAPLLRGRNANTATVVHDDLEWFVGKWVCVARQEIMATKSHWPDEQGPEHIDILNVYYPYWYGEMSLHLDNIPNRKITAEFLITSAAGKQISLEPGQPITIGIDTIIVGGPAPFAIEFRYLHYFDSDSCEEYIDLNTATCRLKLKKVCDLPDGDAKSRFLAPQNEKLIRQWKYDYQRMKYECMNKRH